MANVPSDRKYTKEHEWALAQGSQATVGITAFAGEQLGDIVYVELPKVGDQVKAGGTCGVVESTKAVSDLYSPVTGKVVEINSAAVDGPETVNQDPYGKGWLIKVELANPAEINGLMDAAAYETHIQSAGH